MSAYYTGRGDKGETRILSGDAIKKDSIIIHAIGDVDELNSVIGVALANLSDDVLAKRLLSIQNSLFTIGAELASPSKNKHALKSAISAKNVNELEAWITEMSASLPMLKKFVLPGGSPSGAHLHLARSVCRRAERSVVSATKGRSEAIALVSYLNRLSSFLFVAALHANKSEGVKEKNPQY